MLLVEHFGLVCLPSAVSVRRSGSRLVPCSVSLRVSADALLCCPMLLSIVMQSGGYMMKSASR